MAEQKKMGSYGIFLLTPHPELGYPIFENNRDIQGAISLALGMESIYSITNIGLTVAGSQSPQPALLDDTKKQSEKSCKEK